MAVNFLSAPPPPLNGSFLTSNPTLILVPAITVLVLLIAIVVLLLYCREKPRNDVESRSILHGSFRHGSFTEKPLSKCSSDITANAIFSPDVRSCMYGGKLGFALQEKNRGAQVFTYKELEFATDGFSESNVVGNGGFGQVFRGRLSDGTIAAIKKLHMDGRQGEREFRIEVDLLSRLNFPQLVGLLGYCADQHHRLLVFEFMPNGNLQQHLHQIPQNGQSLDWLTRLRIALDCAKALEFLHEHSSPAVIHRDFKCSNVLLDRNFRAKVSDFGMARVGSDKVNGHVLTRVLGTTGYLAPEYASTGRLTTKSDVYSYGVVLLELLTGRVPVNTKRPSGEHVLVSWALPRLTNREKVMQMVDPVLKGQFSKKDLIQVAAIAAVCVQPEADYRPLMTDVVQSLIPLVVKTPGCSVPTTPLRPHEAV
ncbi:hypothetical protein LUZ60_003723 [Juncus effusus]|nr:hypothetical protein LUZ60_003723 [Juncus effusus]